MTRESTVNKLIEMRLSAMAEAFRDQCASPEVYRDLSFEDRLGFLVDKEWEERRSKKLQRLIRSANLRYPNACMEDIEYHSDRKLDKSQLLRLSSCRYILEAHHIILKGATGAGKTYISNALGVAACKNYLKVHYIRLPDLLAELAIAHGEGTFAKLIKAYKKIDLLILDEFLLTPLTSSQARELLEIIEARSIKGSTIFCTQFEPLGWPSRIGDEKDETICEAIMDRIIHNSYEILVEGRVSMRERHGIGSNKVGEDNE
ncbi:MAG: ATP-binding protein [Tissierellia bacterium]|nr:ATP-binding protein [Tissierellia bacterium]